MALRKRKKAKRRRLGTKMARLYSVLSYNNDGPEFMQSVSLKPHAKPEIVEHALSTQSGVYAPRGLDKLTWSRDGNTAKIVDGNGQKIVVLKLSKHSR
jgi:hypothetical protein